VNSTAVIALAGTGSKLHKSYSTSANASASCMENSLNGQIHSIQFEVPKIMDVNGWMTDYKATDAQFIAWLDQHPEFDVCGKCFRGYKKVGA